MEIIKTVCVSIVMMIIFCVSTWLISDIIGEMISANDNEKWVISWIISTLVAVVAVTVIMIQFGLLMW